MLKKIISQRKKLQNLQKSCKERGIVCSEPTEPTPDIPPVPAQQTQPKTIVDEDGTVFEQFFPSHISPSVNSPPTSKPVVNVLPPKPLQRSLQPTPPPNTSVIRTIDPRTYVEYFNRETEAEIQACPAVPESREGCKLLYPY